MVGDERTVNKLMEDKTGGRRKRRRPRKRWMDDVELELNMGVEKWKTRASNRTERVSVVLGAKARLRGL